MSLGNILTALESNFGPLSADSLTEHWNAGDLDRFRPDGHQWFVEIDPDDFIVSVEALPAAEMAERLPQETKRDDILVIRQLQPDGSLSLSVCLIPAYLRSEIFKS